MGKEKKHDDKRMSRKRYEKELEKLHAELVKLQFWIKEKGLRIIVVFEGRDAAGKGGVIKAITGRVSPRVFRVVALPAPSDQEKTQMYIQRYMRHFPSAGEIVIFDRSWYNRAGVERVMGFCSREEYIRFLQYTPLLERAMVDSGILLFKYWLDVSMDVQEKRFRERIDDPRKIWKLSPMDVASFQRWYDYSRARDDMLAATDLEYSPWTIVPADDKRRARLNCIAHLLSRIDYEDVTGDRIELDERKSEGAYDDRATLEGRHFVPSAY
ncbi:MAG: polyphosphate kinase 2 [Gammaproteobacteria bacterium]|jgi:polyphosphate kinase 2